MNKRQAHHLSRKTRSLKPGYFFAIAVLSAVVCVFALRANNQRMVELREAVYQADKENGDVEKALQDLQAYVTTHMNTDLGSGPNSVYPPIQLKYTYERLVQAQGAERARANQELYTQAQKHCEQQNSQDFSGRNRIPCIQQYVQSHTTPDNAPIPDSLYKFSFLSPRWSPDLAGWSMAVSILSAFAGSSIFIAQRLLKRLSS